ncbi:hypothetical protein T11_18266 [Trichinella zimbabwensis]|uniref:Uncharacterized protein n=1 Tax=Trichinella zimbabwensis TaxID=268475 RepID=A0A0V1F5B0_9BILA|nr:hypothetical protein T11_18266 [Trichinella zimbabwensis]
MLQFLIKTHLFTLISPAKIQPHLPDWPFSDSTYTVIDP